MLADFIINIEDCRKPMAVQVKVHNSVWALRNAAIQYCRRISPLADSEEFLDTLGICHRFHMDDQALCAIIRLAPPNLGAGIVAHEMAHAAIWLWEIEHKFEEKDHLNNSNDEWFCWILGELVRQTTIKLIEHKIE